MDAADRTAEAGYRVNCIAVFSAATTLCLAISGARATPPTGDPWNDYHIIMWQDQNAAQYATLKKIGVDAGRAIWRAQGEKQFADVVAPFRAAGMGWYAENIATDFYASYHRWTPGKPVNWRFLDAQRRYRENPRDPAAFVRVPSLSDPVWLDRIRDRLTRVVQASRPYPALFYNLADEPGIADLGAYWDFDLSPASLAGMRGWLRAQYGTLSALNRQWGTRFSRWNLVMPMTTDEALARSDENFSAWADFKAWMDEAFARAIRAGTAAVHAAEPTARAGIEGGQIPGWGGYDYTRLAGAVDVMELYDNGENVDIVRSLAPDTVLLATLYGAGPAAQHHVWRSLLQGGRGLILWDPKSRFAHPDGTPGPRAAAFAGLFAKLRGGVGAQLIASQRVVGPVAMLYSPASFRTRWMLDLRRTGGDWSTRTASDEYRDNAIRAARRAFGGAIARLGLQHRFVSPEQLAGGALERRGDRVLILPHAIALSPGEAGAIRRFVAAGGTVVADAVPGTYDAHSRRLPVSPLADLFPRHRRPFAHGRGMAVRLSATGRGRQKLTDALAGIFAGAGIEPPFPLTLPNGRRTGGVDSYVFRNGATTLVALHSTQPNVAWNARSTLTLALPPGSFVTDLIAGRPLGRRDRLEVTLGPVAPAIFAVSPAPQTLPEIEPPPAAQPGTEISIRVRRSGSAAAVRVLHVAVSDPQGRAVARLSGNLPLAGETAAWPLVFRRDDPPGTWRVHVTDILAGAGRTVDVVLVAR